MAEQTAPKKKPAPSSKPEGKKQEKKKKQKQPKNIPKIIKSGICFVLALAILAFVPYMIEYVNIKVEENAKAAASLKTTSSSSKKVTTSSAASAASKPTSSAASQQAVQEATQNATQKGTKQASAVSLTSMTPVLQAPEFLSGCEVASLTSVLDFYGENIDKITLSVLFLPRDNTSTTKNGKTYRASPWKTFVGDPELQYYGCFAPVIVETANGYFKGVGSDKKAVNLTGAEPSKLYEYIEKNVPVIVWATQNMQKSSVTTTWYDKDTNELIEWPGSEHCLVLLAYTDKTVTMCDPAKGIVNYDRNTFEERYKELHQQAVVIQ